MNVYPLSVMVEAMKFKDLKTALEAMTRKQANEMADKAGIPRSTVAKIRKGHTEDPGVLTVEALAAVMQPKRVARMKAGGA